MLLCDMKLKEFLERNKVIMQSALAVLMWPEKNNQAKVFSNKINEALTGKSQSKQRITEDDEARAKVVLLELADKIKEFAGDQDIKPVLLMKDLPKKADIKSETPKKFNLAAELEKIKKENNKPGATKQ